MKFNSHILQAMSKDSFIMDIILKDIKGLFWKKMKF